jgi:beta-glucanase (GH16 family)
MRPALPALLAAFLWAGVAAAGPAAPPDCRWQLAFADDFTHPAIAAHTLGPARWTAHTPWNGDFGAAAFGDPSPDPGTGPFSSGAQGLRITASRDDTGHWHSGLIAAADASGHGAGVRHGYFEARMKLPPGPGTWPAFWLMSLLPAHDPAPAVEIDVMEYYGHATDAYQTSLHVWYRGKDIDRSRHDKRSIPVPAGSLVGQWHDYGVRVGPRDIIWYLDHAEVWRRPTPPELTGPLYPLVNLALGSGYPVRDTPNPSMLALRDVRVYRDLPEGCPATLPPASSALP